MKTVNIYRLIQYLSISDFNSDAIYRIRDGFDIHTFHVDELHHVFYVLWVRKVDE